MVNWAQSTNEIYYFNFTGFLLAVIPLLPHTSHWEYYKQEGICSQLPITRKPFEGEWYSFGVTIVLNVIIYLLVAAGQSVICLSVETNLVTTDTTRKSQDMVIARRLISVVVSNFVCWFPIILLGLVASAGVPVSGEVTVVMAIFVLPLNSALNPFLYTFNIVMEKRRKARELSLLNFLEAQIVANETTAETGGPLVEGQPRLTVENVLLFLGESLVSGAITIERISAALQTYRHDLKLIVSDNPDTTGD